MKKRNARAVLCTFSVIGFSVMTGTAAMAAEDSDRITIPYLQQTTTGGKVVGYIPFNPR